VSNIIKKHYSSLARLLEIKNMKIEVIATSIFIVALVVDKSLVKFFVRTEEFALIWHKFNLPLM